MSYNLNESSTFINIKLTDAGRRMISLGRLNFKKAVFSDREINYDIDRTGYYDILSNRILSPADYHPDIDPINYDDTNAITLDSQNVVSAKQFVTASTTTAGFFTGSTNAWTIDTGKTLGNSTISYSTNSSASNWSTTHLTVNSGGYAWSVGDLVFVPWVCPTGVTLSSTLLPSGTPINCLWYRIASAISSTVMVLDRPIPDFVGSATRTTKAYFYPNNGIENYYGSGSTQQTRVWNMNIVRTYNVAGTNEATSGISGYTRYGSIQYNGTRRFFGFSSETPSVGFVHYTNEFSGNTYGEQFIEKSIQMYLPAIMWHNIGGNNGTTFQWGASFYDYYGVTTYDDIARTTYRELRDGVASTSRVVGRVYHKLKMIVITDQELLNILSYKSNRNYSLPDFNVSLTSTPKYPLNNSQATGLCDEDYTYFITYIADSVPFASGVPSYGYPQSVHCGYIKKIDGSLDINGNPQFLQLTFPPNSFPYLRSNSYLGVANGWNAQTVQILVNEQLKSLNYDVANVPSDSWKRLSLTGSGGNGVYRASDAGDTTIDPLKLNGHTFVVSREDYVSGTTYTIASGLTTSQDVLNFGSESFFHGVLDVQIFATTYKSVISVAATNNQLNSSTNPTYDDVLDTKTYITEVAILDDTNQVVAVGKPTYPLPKNLGRYLVFQLEMDF